MSLPDDMDDLDNFDEDDYYPDWDEGGHVCPECGGDGSNWDGLSVCRMCGGDGYLD